MGCHHPGTTVLEPRALLEDAEGRRLYTLLDDRVPPQEINQGLVLT